MVLLANTTDSCSAPRPAVNSRNWGLVGLSDGKKAVAYVSWAALKTFVESRTQEGGSCFGTVAGANTVKCNVTYEGASEDQGNQYLSRDGTSTFTAYIGTRTDIWDDDGY